MKKELKEIKKKEEKIVIPEPAEDTKEAEKIEIAEIAAVAEEAPEVPYRRKSREEMEKEARAEKVASWVPKTEIGRKVKEGKIKNIDEILESGKKILEYQIVDKLMPNIQMDLLTIGQAKGKFGGGKRRFWRQTQRKTAEGNVPSFACMVVVGDGNGHVGLGMGKAKETLPAKEKALRAAKLGLISIKRGCGSFDCSCSDLHSIPFKIEGKVGSSIMKLIPAPKGTGLVIDGECKKIMAAAGIKDVYSRSFGQTRTKINLAQACVNALKSIKGVKR